METKGIAFYGVYSNLFFFLACGLKFAIGSRRKVHVSDRVKGNMDCIFCR